MKITFLFLLIILSRSVFSNELQPAGSQNQDSSSFHFGLEAGYSRNFHAAELKDNYHNELISINNLTGNGYYAGIGLTYYLDHAISILGKLHYSNLNAQNKFPYISFPSLVDDGKGSYQTVYQDYYLTSRVQYSGISAKFLIKIYTGIDCLFFFAGGFVSYDIGKIVFARQIPGNSMTIETIIYKEIPDQNRFGLGLTFGIQYNINLGKYIILPEIIFDIRLISASGSQEWKIYSLKTGLSFYF